MKLSHNAGMKSKRAKTQGQGNQFMLFWTCKNMQYQDIQITP